jgi:hypothetical protein
MSSTGFNFRNYGATVSVTSEFLNDEYIDFDGTTPEVADVFLQRYNTKWSAFTMGERDTTTDQPPSHVKVGFSG